MDRSDLPAGGETATSPGDIPAHGGSSMLARIAAACLMVGTAAAPASAVVTFEYTEAIVSWTAPMTTQYRITAIGAAGANGSRPPIGRAIGGRGASIAGSFSFSAGQTFFVAVGGRGGDDACNAGGGGGSFFVGANNAPLLVAGGGGGARVSGVAPFQDASITEDATAASGTSQTRASGFSTTARGQGGRVSSASWGSAGAGFFSNGQADFAGANAGGKSWSNGLAGGVGNNPPAFGGFGGGGSGNGACGGGGGGYTGGDGGRVAGGGGSFNAGADPVAIAGVGDGDGLITIDFDSLPPSAVPEPASWALLVAGFGVLGGSLRRRRSVAA